MGAPGKPLFVKRGSPGNPHNFNPGITYEKNYFCRDCGDLPDNIRRVAFLLHREDRQDEGAFLAEVGALIEKSYEVNEIFFGKGLEFEDEGKTPDEILAECKTEEEKIYLYLPVKESAKYKTREEIMNLAHAVYSASYCEYLEARGFEGISDGDAVANYARYIEDLTYGLTVNVKSAAEAMKLDRTYDISTLAISRKGRDFVAVTVDAYENGEFAEKKTFKVKLEDSGEWRLDWPTY